MCGLCCAFSLSAQTISKFIHVDQFGYMPNASKVAVISDPQTGFNASDNYTPSATLELRNASNDAVVFSGAPSIWDNGNTHSQSGDKGWWFDFSTYVTPGTYYVYDPGNDESSAAFEIGTDVYTSVLIATFKMFYYNRCNASKVAPYAGSNWTDGGNFENNLQDANCRYYLEPNNASLEKDLTGGWFDAGDYNKYVTFASSAVHMLLSAYEDNPEVCTDAWGIPESGNGMPDILDEVKWELDWLLKMINTDGSVIIKMGSVDYADNALAPPSANTDPRYYGLTCTSASIAAAGMLAHAANVYSGIPGMSAYAAQLQDQAELTWSYVEPLITSNSLETTCDDGTIKSGDADRSVAEQREEALVAAIQLFKLTGETDYNDYIAANITDAEPLQFNFWSAYKLSLNEALLEYTTLPGANATTKSTILNSINAAATNNWDGLYGFNNNDLYRAFMPDWAYHWGSSLPKAGFGILNLQLNKYGINSANQADHREKAMEQLHFFHGVNPLGLVYISNMYDYGGDRCVNEIYHTWFNDGTDWDNVFSSTYGPAPGFVSGGPNSTYDSNVNLSPPYGQPEQKSYLDFNTGWPDDSWELSEPAIYYQANYVRLLANLITNDGALAVDWFEPLWGFYEDGINHLRWITQSEENNDRFEVERSPDGRSWSKIATVKGQINTAEASRYAYEDHAPLSGLNYYRLRQVDTDESFTYSNIISIENKLLKAFRLLPNPAENTVSIQTNISDGLVEIISIDGSLSYRQRLNDATHLLPISDLPRGVYFVRLTDNTGRQMVEKLIKH